MTDTSFSAGPGASGADVPPNPSAPAVPGASGPTSVGGAPGTPQAYAPPPQPSTPSIFGTPDPSANPISQFGSGLNKTFGGSQYQPAPAGADATDQSINLLQQRIQRASSIATGSGGPMGFMATIFDPEGVQKARDAVPKMTEELKALQQQKAKDVEVKQLARNYGINNIPAGADRETATNMMADELQARYLKGDPIAATALTQLGRTDLVQAGGEQALSAAAANNARYRDAIGKLNNVQNAGQYNAAYKELEKQTKEGKHQQWELASVPKTFDEYQDKKQMINNSLSTQQLQLNALKAKMQQLGGVTPIQKSVDKDGNAIGLHAAVSSQLRDNNGNPMGGVEPVTVGGIYNGNRLPSGSGVIGDAGVKWGLMTKDEVKDVGARIEPHKTTVERASGINKLNDIAAAKDFGSNAWLLGHGIDQFVEISRNGVGGRGSATPGTIQIMENLRGHLQTMGDKAQKEWRQVEDWVDGGKKGPMPYMSTETINGLKSAITTLKQGSDKEISGVAGGIASYVGRHGGKLDDLGFEPGVVDALKPYWQQGNTEFKQDIASRPAVVMGGQRIVFDRDGVKPPNAMTPGGFDQPQPTAAAPNGARGNPPPAANVPANPGPGSGPPGGPVTIAGQPVTPNLPAGVSPNYLPAMQRIESGNERDPWTAGTKGSSASGAFQMIDSTWRANRPPGATAARAKDATPAQQTAANDKFMATNAAALQRAGIPVNDVSMYVTHNLGEGSGPKLLRASPNADARSVVGEDAARNNPLFFKGRPTVATVLARYDNEMNKGGATGGDIADVARHSAAAHARQQPAAPGLSSWLQGGDPSMTNPESAFSDASKKQMSDNLVNNAPVIGSTAGAVAGSFAAPGLGTMAGGGAGGAAGQAFKDYMQGRPQDPRAIAKQGALGAVLGIAGPEGAPLAGAAMRVGGVAAVSAGAEKLAGGENSDVLRAGLEGGAYALTGEALGKFVSMGGAEAYKALSRYTTSAQAELSAQAGKLAEARATLESENPKLPGDAGPNPKYEAAKKVADDATKAIEDHGQKPDDMVHAYEQAKAGVSSGEAAVTRGAVKEKNAVSEGYNDLRQQTRETGVGAPKPNQPVPDGPLAQLRTTDNLAGKVPAQFRPEAEHAEMLIKAPAKDWGEKWQQLQNAGSELINKRLDFLQAGDKSSAKAMDDLFQGVRNQQKAAAEYVFGKAGGEKVIGQLENLDTRYAKVMNATAGMDYQKMSGILAEGNTPRARELEANFKAFAKGDPGAIRAFNAMKAGAKGDWKTEANLMAPVIAGEVSGVVPTAGALTAVVGGYRLYKFVQNWMNNRMLGKAVMFKDFLAQEVGPTLPQAGAGQRNLVQGSAFPGQPGQTQPQQ